MRVERDYTRGSRCKIWIKWSLSMNVQIYVLEFDGFRSEQNSNKQAPNQEYYKLSLFSKSNREVGDDSC